jgi:glycosyltransferase involved in cell wall biosynthesis
MDRVPLISVIIPAYNHGNVIHEALNSVFAQTFRDYEIIVVNDGSPDNTAEVLKPLAEAGKIRYFEQSNGGQASARNRGLAEARGELIAYLDDDDVWPEDKLGWQVAILQADSQAAVVYGRETNMGAKPGDYEGNSNLPNGSVHEAFCAGNHIRSPGQAMIRADVLRAANGFDLNIKGADDWDLWIRLSKDAPFRFENRIALYCRNHSANASRNLWAMYSNCMRVVRKHFRADKVHFRIAKRHVKAYVADGFFESVKREVWAGRKGPALKSLFFAGILDPKMVLSRAKKAFFEQGRIQAAKSA